MRHVRNSISSAHRTRPTTLLSLLLACTLAGALWLGTAAAQAEPTPGGSLTFGMEREPDNLDPHTNASALSTRILSNIVETLVFLDQSGEMHPYLATSWSVNEDATAYGFTLREGVTFHDGTPFNAEAVRYNFDRIVDPELIVGAARTAIGPYERTEVVGEYEVVVHFTEPFAAFLTNSGVNELGMISPTSAEEQGLGVSDRPVGSGPFIVRQWLRGDRLVLDRNADYDWAPAPLAHDGPAYLDTVTIVFAPEAGVRVGALQSGELQLAEYIPGVFLSIFEGSDDYRVYRVGGPGAGKYVLMNMQRAPTDDRRVREAIHRAVNRQEMIDAIWFGIYRVSDGPIQSNVFGYWDGVEDAYPYSPDVARELLDEAGWVAGPNGMRSKDGVPLAVDMYTVEGFQIHNDFQIPFQAYLQEVGFRVNIIQLPGAVRRGHQTAGDHHLLPGIFPGVDPDILRRQYHSGGIGEGGQNASFMADSELDAILDAAKGEPDRERRAELYRQAQEIIYIRDVAVVPIYAFTDVYALEAAYDGLKFNVSGHPLFVDVHRNR